MREISVILEVNGINYQIVYDDDYFNEILTTLGITGKKCVSYLKKSILYFFLGEKKVRNIYEKIAKDSGLSYQTIVSHIRNGLVMAEFNGGLKNIDDIFGLEIYDYDYGFTNKGFIALMCDYMSNNNLLKTIYS